jgi:hypothetical protein
MARLFPGHTRAGNTSGTKEAQRRPPDYPRSTVASRTAEAVKKSLDFSGPGGSSADCDILNKIMAGMSGTLLKKD